MKMKGRIFVKKIFAKYKWLLIALLMISIIAVPMVVNTLFKFSSNFFRQSGRQEMRFLMFLAFKPCLGLLYLALSLLSRDKTHKKSIGA